MVPNPTLDQLQIFLAVAESGSFSAASRRLNRAQSVVSYTIANLEAQLDLQLFERNGVRQPRLSEAGQALLEDARRMLSSLQTLRARVKTLKQGVEAEVNAILSVMIPSSVIVAALKDFQYHFPSVTLRMQTGSLGELTDYVAREKVDFSIGGIMLHPDDRLVFDKIGYSSMLPVAASNHPLAQHSGKLTLSDVQEHVQLVVADSSRQTEGQDFNVFSYRTWRVGDMAMKHQLILGGLGWGGLPASMIQKDIKSGRLTLLPFEAYNGRNFPLYATMRVADPPGPAGTWLIQCFQTHLSQCSPEFSSV